MKENDMLTQDYATTTQRTLVTNEDLTIRRLPVRNPLATKNDDGSYTYMGHRYYSRSTLGKRGWSQDDISEVLGDATVITRNPYNTNMQMELFLAIDVEECEYYMGCEVYDTPEALANGNITAGIKIKINTIQFSGVYTSDGYGNWLPCVRNQQQTVLTTMLLEFWYENGFPVEYISN
jgi:hypothetical protein